MKALIQRVTQASVTVDGDTVGSIDTGLLVFLGVERGDSHENADRIVQKILDYRVFSDADGKMNLSVSAIEGGVLLVSQFTLAADTSKGLRPGFSSAAPPDHARSLYDYVAEKCAQQLEQVATGIFAADMRVALVNDGPVTFLLEA